MLKKAILFILKHIVCLFACLIFYVCNTNLAFAQSNEQYRLYYFGQFGNTEQKRDFIAGGIHYEPSNEWFRTEFRTSRLFFIGEKIDLAISQRSYLTVHSGKLNHIEIRPIQYITYHHVFNPKFRLDHRFMLEERFFINMDNDNEFIARFRYRLDTRFMLSNIPVINKKGYVRPMSEVFINFASNEYDPYPSQWKNVLALGCLLSNNITLEFRYEHSLLQNSDRIKNTYPFNTFRLQVNHRF